MTQEAPQKPFWILADLIDRHYESVGAPPECIYANRGFKGEFERQIMEDHIPMFPCAENGIGSDEFEFQGVLVKCVIKTRNTVSVCHYVR